MMKIMNSKIKILIGVLVVIAICVIAGYFLLWQKPPTQPIGQQPLQVMLTSEIMPQCRDRAYVADTADYIIEGTVERIKFEHPREIEVADTYNDVKIEKFIKGDLKSSEIQVVIYGDVLERIYNQFGEIIDYPPLHEGEKVRIYFEKRNDKFFITCSIFGIEK